MTLPFARIAPVSLVHNPAVAGAGKAAYPAARVVEAGARSGTRGSRRGRRGRPRSSLSVLRGRRGSEDKSERMSLEGDRQQGADGAHRVQAAGHIQVRARARAHHAISYTAQLINFVAE
jgi:hypothetical protein